MKRFKKFNTAATILVSAATAIFLTKTLLKYYTPIQDTITSIPPIKIIFAIFLFLGYLYMRAISWKFLVQYFGESISKVNSLTIWFFSEAVRYIPGNIWSFASRAYLAQQKQISKNASFLVLPTEVILVTTTTTILSSYAIVKILERGQVNLIFYILTITSLVVILALLLLHKTVTKILKKLLTQNLSLRALLSAIACQFLSWSLYSAGYLVLIPDAKTLDLLLLYSATLLAWLIGYLTIVSPLGLGVRESAFVLLVGTRIGTAEALVVAILARLVLIATELINLAFWASLKRSRIFKVE